MIDWSNPSVYSENGSIWIFCGSHLTYLDRIYLLPPQWFYTCLYYTSCCTVVLWVYFVFFELLWGKNCPPSLLAQCFASSYYLINALFYGIVCTNILVSVSQLPSKSVQPESYWFKCSQTITWLGPVTWDFLIMEVVRYILELISDNWNVWFSLIIYRVKLLLPLIAP